MRLRDIDVRIWIAALLLVPALPAQTLALVRDPPSETSFRLSPAEFSYPGTYRSLRQIDFRNLAVNFVKDRLVPLKDGKYESRDEGGFDGVEFESVDFLTSAARSKEQFALVLYTHTLAGGSSNSYGVAQIFGLSSGHLRIVQEIAWDEHFSPPGNWYMRLSKDTLTLRSARYLDGDAHCCISGMDTITLKWNGSRFTQTSITTTRLEQ